MQAYFQIDFFIQYVIPERVPIYLQNLILNAVRMTMIFQTYYAANNIHTPKSDDL
jgi:hypothetical protein